MHLKGDECIMEVIKQLVLYCESNFSTPFLNIIYFFTFIIFKWRNLILRHLFTQKLKLNIKVKFIESPHYEIFIYSKVGTSGEG